MSKEQGAILEKVRKLLALAGNNPNEHEAALAAEKAQQLLADHNLSMIDTEEPRSGIVEEEETTRYVWESLLLSTIAKVNFCFIYKIERTRTIVGRPENIAVALETYRYLKMTVQRLTILSKFKRRDAVSFAYGAASRLATRIQEQAKARTASSPIVAAGNALMIVSQNEKAAIDQYFRDKGMRFGNARRSSGSYNYGAVNAGRSAADSVGLHGQIRAGSSSQRLLN